MGYVSLIDGHIENAEHCVCCGQVIPEGSQYCIVCGYKVNQPKKRQIDRIRNMSVEEMAEFIKTAVEDCEKYCAFTKNGKCNCFGIEDKCAEGIKQWLEQEVEE
jgi:predicted nucleic acid-binding Zn ribbon protein